MLRNPTTLENPRRVRHNVFVDSENKVRSAYQREASACDDDDDDAMRLAIDIIRTSHRHLNHVFKNGFPTIGGI